jgi:two-component system sensor histidine kinase AlgZ
MIRLSMNHSNRLYPRKYLRRILWVNLGAAAVAVLLLMWFQSVNLRDLAYALVNALVYAYSIGTPSALFLPLVANRVARRPLWVKITALGAAIAVLTVTGCVIAALVLILLRVEPAAAMWARFGFVVRFTVLVALVIGLSVFFVESLRSQLQETTLELRTRQLSEERAKKLATEARLSSLESRIHPHFLFNTLNSIAALIHDDPQRAEEIVGRLAALLRFSLDANQCSLVPLEQELKIVRDYLEIEKARFGERLRYSIEAAPETLQASLPPLALESLVENSVKHAIAPKREGGEVRVRAGNSGGSIEIEVADTGPGFSLSDIPAGHGLDNLLARLDAIYSGRARLDVATGAGGTSVHLLLPETP